MVDPDLERRIADCQELMESWKQFMELVSKAIKPPHATTPQLEQQFLNNKARIAMLHDSFMESLKHDKNVGSNMIDIVNRAITLGLLQKLSEPECKKLETEWHEVFLLLNETVSTMQEEKAKLADVNEMAFKLGKVKESILVKLKSFFGSIWFKIGIALFAFIFIIWGIPAFGIYDYDKLRDVGPLEQPLTMYYNVGRNQLGLGMPYFNLKSFQDQMPPEIVGVGDIKDITTEKDKESSARDLIRFMNAYDDDPYATLEVFQEADNFAVHTYRMSGGNQTAELYMFYFRNSEGAQRLYSTLLAHESKFPDNVRVARKANVFLIARGPGGPLDLVNEGVFKTMKP